MVWGVSVRQPAHCGNSLFHGTSAQDVIAPFLQLQFGALQQEATGAAVSLNRSYVWNSVRGVARCGVTSPCTEVRCRQDAHLVDC